jgi:hypothetical protein
MSDLTIVSTRFCKKCQAETPQTSDGRCRPCRLDQSRKRYAANPSKWVAGREAWKTANLLKVREYAAAYYQANREKHATSRDKWRAANRDKENATNAAYKAANPEKSKAHGEQWRKANPDRHRANKAAWREANREKLRETSSAWFAANPGIRRIYSQNRRSLESKSGGKLSKDIATKLFKLQQGKCAVCMSALDGDYHLDHIMPIALGGSNTDENIQLLHSLCNMQKNAKHPIDYMQSRGFLL